MKKNLAVSVKMLVDTFRVCSMESMLKVEHKKQPDGLNLLTYPCVHF